MLNLLKKRSLTVFSAVFLTAVSSSLSAGDCFCEPPSCNRLYVGGFGGGIYPNRTHMSQMGTAFFTEAEGGPLVVDARGHAKGKNGTGFGGVQVGYELAGFAVSSCSDWVIAPAFEVEAFWYENKRKGHLFNETSLDRLPEHDFLNTFKENTGVYLANLVFSLNNTNRWGISPYVGVGVGATRISIKRADSLQVAPLEVGINHFNGRRNDSTWAFAAQAKVGLRYKICNSFHIFGEYRCLFVDSTNYIFGSTQYPGHAPTTPWNVKQGHFSNNAFAFGIQYDL